MKLLGIFFSLLLLVYLVLPGPTRVANFSNLPAAYKSQEPGETVQIPNAAGFYSFKFRTEVTGFYKDNYQALTKFPFPPIRLNYPPEYAFTAIKDQTQSTFLEEFVYPMRDSLFINGFEPFYEDGEPKFKGAVYFGLPNGAHYPNKTTIRFYPSSVYARLLVWLGVNISIILLWKAARKVFLRKVT